MLILLAFAIALIVTAFLSRAIEHTVLSASVLFLGAGMMIGKAGWQWVNLEPTDPIISQFIELALVSVLFTDGMKVGIHELLGAWRLPGRALLFGMPLAFLFTAIASRLVLNFQWPESFLISAALAPTDPAFSSAILKHASVPSTVKKLLGIESGLNDGLALPIVLVTLSLAREQHLQLAVWSLEIVKGIILGVAIPFSILWLRNRIAARMLRDTDPELALGLLVALYACSKLLDGNLFLAVFIGGVTIASMDTRLRDKFMPHGGLLSDVFKYATVLVLASLIRMRLFLSPLSWYLFVFIVLFLSRPLSILIALWKSGMKRHERIASEWFGPKGFATILYALLILTSGIPAANQLFSVIALVVVFSILFHSSTDVVVAKWFDVDQSEKHAAS